MRFGRKDLAAMVMCMCADDLMRAFRVARNAPEVTSEPAKCPGL